VKKLSRRADTECGLGAETGREWDARHAGRAFQLDKNSLSEICHLYFSILLQVGIFKRDTGEGRGQLRPTRRISFAEKNLYALAVLFMHGKLGCKDLTASYGYEGFLNLMINRPNGESHRVCIRDKAAETFTVLCLYPCCPT